MKNSQATVDTIYLVGVFTLVSGLCIYAGVRKAASSPAPEKGAHASQMDFYSELDAETRVFYDDLDMAHLNRVQVIASRSGLYDV